MDLFTFGVALLIAVVIAIGPWVFWSIWCECD